MKLFRSMLYMARRFKLETAMNFIGLTVAFSAFYLLMTQVDYSANYNRSIPDYERVMRLETFANTYSCRMLNAIIQEMPQVEGVSEMNGWVYWDEFKAGDHAETYSCVGTGLTPFGAMNARCLSGRLEWNDYGERTIILPASLARRLYNGRIDVAGEPIVWNGDKMAVLGVYEDFPDNCSMKNHIYFDDSHNLNDTINWSYLLFLKLREGANAHALEEQLANFGYSIRPVSETWFSGVDSNDRGNRSMLQLMQLAALLIIVVAIANFLNFTLAESPMRIRSINTRRVLGEGVWSLRRGLIVETIATALAAMVTGLLLCYVVAQQQFELLQGNVSPGNHPLLVGLMVALAVASGIVAGAYPAFFVTSFEPALALKGSFGLTPRGRKLRSLLVGSQLGIAVFMVVYMGILLLQMRYIFHSHYGYEKDNVLCAPLVDDMQSKKETIRRQLMEIEGVADVSYSRFMLGTQDFYVSWSCFDGLNGASASYACLYVDCHYLRTMGIRVIEGRDFNERDVNCFIVNEAARQQWPWVEVGKPLGIDGMPVIGVCENVRYASARKDCTQEPMAFVVLSNDYENWGDQLGMVNVRVEKDADKLAVRQQMQDVLDRIGYNGTVISLNQQIEFLYEDEQRFISLITWLSVICLTITFVGVFCLTMFETEYRRKEIGIRKVMGASIREIIAILFHRYLWLLVMGFVCAAPAAWYFGHEWLLSFVERTSIPWWLFPLALVAVGFTTLATVILQGWRVANENPVHSIKNE